MVVFPGRRCSPRPSPGEDADPTVGPTISACIDHTDGTVYGENIFIQDGGMPNLLRTSVGSWHCRLPKWWQKRTRPFKDWADDTEPLDRVMPWFARGIDASDGRLHLRRRWRLFGPQRLTLDWDIARSESTIEAIVNIPQATRKHLDKLFRGGLVRFRRRPTAKGMEHVCRLAPGFDLAVLDGVRQARLDASFAALKAVYGLSSTQRAASGP